MEATEDGRRDAQGNVHIRTSSLEALLPDDLEKHAQLNRVKLNSCGVLGKRSKQTVRSRSTKTRNRKVLSHPGGHAPMDIGAFGKGKGIGKGKQRNKDNKDETGVRTRTRTRIPLNVGTGKRGHHSKDCWSTKNTNKGGSKGKHKSRNATDAHNIDSTKPANAEPEVEVGEFEMGFFYVDAQQESEWIKNGVDTGAGKTVWPQSVTYGKKLPGHVDLTFRTATGETVKSSERLYVESFDDWEVNLRVRGVRAQDARRWVESLSCMDSKVTCSTSVRTLPRKSIRRSRRR